jgi:hypothetical protein
MGSLFLGVTLAFSSIQTSHKGTVALSLLVPILVLGFPITDTLLSMVRRFIRGKSMFSGDKGHIHHRLLHVGLDHKRAACVIYAVCMIFSLLALAVVLQNSFMTGLMLLVLVVVFCAGLWFLGYFQTFFTPNFSRERLLFKEIRAVTQLAKVRLALAEDVFTALELLRQACQDFGKPAVEVSLSAVDPAETDIHRHWRRESGSQFAVGGLTQIPHEWKRETCHFDDSGLVVSFFFQADGDSEELRLEKRTMLADIIESAHSRLLELRRQKMQPAEGKVLTVGKITSKATFSQPEMLAKVPDETT